MAADLSDTFTGVPLFGILSFCRPPPPTSPSRTSCARSTGVGRRCHEDNRAAPGGSTSRAEDEVLRPTPTRRICR